MKRIFASLVIIATASSAQAEDFVVDPRVGNSTFTAIFDASLGERISAVGSAVECHLTLDDKSNTASGRCSVPLASIRVDNEDTKTEHFQQWTTNKKSDPKTCRFEATFPSVKLHDMLAAEKPVGFATDATFTVCGRPRIDGAQEKVTGTAVLFPAGKYGTAKTIRIRARIDGFSREKYQVGPKFTAGWLARVQSLAKVVADQGTIELNLFAHPASP